MPDENRRKIGRHVWRRRKEAPRLYGDVAWQNICLSKEEMKMAKTLNVKDIWRGRVSESYRLSFSQHQSESCPQEERESCMQTLSGMAYGACEEQA